MEGDWHLNKAVTLGLILSLLAQTTAVVWWGSDINARVEDLEEWRMESKSINERIVRQEERTISVQAGVSRMEVKLDSILERISDLERVNPSASSPR